MISLFKYGLAAMAAALILGAFGLGGGHGATSIAFADDSAPTGGPPPGGFIPPGNLLQVAADTLGLSLSDLMADLRAGQSLGDIAENLGKEQALEDALVAAAKAGIAQAAADGRIPPEIAARMLNGVYDHVEDLLNTTGRPGDPNGSLPGPARPDGAPPFGPPPGAPDGAPPMPPASTGASGPPAGLPPVGFPGGSGPMGQGGPGAGFGFGLAGPGAGGPGGPGNGGPPPRRP